MNAPQPFFNFHQQISEIVLVGCGGTGAVWARCIARIVWDLLRRRQHVPVIRFVDPDRVELKNVGRQMFVPQEIGQFKAEVLARRFNLALGLPIAWYNEPFDAEKHTARYGTVVCGAVDNHLARTELAKVHGLWIEAGNHLAGGQVTIGNSGDRKQILRAIRNNDYALLPNAALLFPQLLAEEASPEAPLPAASCAALVDSGDQQLLVNDFMASIAAEYTFKVLNRLPIRTFLTHLDLDVLAMRSIRVCREELLTPIGTGPRPRSSHSCAT